MRTNRYVRIPGAVLMLLVLTAACSIKRIAPNKLGNVLAASGTTFTSDEDPEIYAAIVIQAPLLVSIGSTFDIDPVHLGIVFLANLELGYLTPPIGLNLRLS